MYRKETIIKTSIARKIWIKVNVAVHIWSYTFLQSFDLVQNYTTTYLYDDIIRHIFELEYSTVVSNLYGLIQCILYIFLCHTIL